MALFVKTPPKYLMPEGFVFGVGGSAWQEEGKKPGVNDPWTVWVNSPAFLNEPEVRGISGVNVAPRDKGCMGEILYHEDYALISRFGLKMRRISAAMEKVEPAEGVFDPTELARLRNMVIAGKLFGVETMLTIDHWVQSIWFQESGGWEREDAPQLVARHAEAIMKELGGLVNHFTILNEPTVSTFFGWDHGVWPPFVKDRKRTLKVLQKKADAHCLVRDVILKYNPNAQIGIAHALEWRSASPANEQEKEDRYMWDYWILDELMRRESLNFIGINNYFHSEPGKEGWSGHDPCTHHPVQSDMQWGMCINSLYHIVYRVYARYGLPIWITEHGHAVREIEDHRRCWHMFHSLRGLSQAIAEGVDVHGYIHWSFIDNDEWKYRYDKKFGLFAVDQNDPDRKRTPRRSAYLLKAIADAGGPTDMIEKEFKAYVSHPHATVA